MSDAMSWTHRSSDMFEFWWDTHFKDADAWLLEHEDRSRYAVMKYPTAKKWRVLGITDSVGLWHEEKAIAEFNTLEEAKRYAEVLCRME